MASDWKWNIRKALPSDIPFIYATWLNTVWNHGSYKADITKTTFYGYYTQVIDNILRHKDTTTAVACHFEDPEVMFGYLVGTGDVAHFACVKEAFQNYGIAKSLYAHLKLGEFYTHKTRALNPVLDRHPNLKFNPFLLMLPN